MNEGSLMRYPLFLVGITLLATSHLLVARLRTEVGDGALAYSNGKELHLAELPTNKTTIVGKGRKPEFSPDSSKLAWNGSNEELP
jgi:hypothetical protein